MEAWKYHTDGSECVDKEDCTWRDETGHHRVLAETGTPYIPDGWTGPITQCADCGNDAPDEPCKRRDQPDGPLCGPCRNGQLMLHMHCWKCGAGKFLFVRTGVVEYTAVSSFNDDDAAVIDDHAWDSDPSDTSETHVKCDSCGTIVLKDVDYEVDAA